MHQFITRLAFLSLVSCASIALAQPPTQAPQSSVRAVDWQPAALPPAVFTDWSGLSVRPGLSAARAQTPEGEAAIMRVEAKTRNALIPINIEIPPDTRTLGVWLREGVRGTDGPASGAEAAGMDITVQFVRDSKTENVKLSQLLSATPKSNAQNAGFTPFAKEDGWVLRRAFLDSVGDGRPAKRIVLRSLRLTGATTRVLDFGPLLACPQSTSTTSARMVWKLKDFQEVKPVSNNWTSTQFYEYGYDENPLLRASAWKRLLRKPGEPTVAANASQVASLRAIIRASNGTPLQTFTRRGEELHSALPLPVLGEGSYFLQLSGFDASGVLVGEVPFVYQMLRHDAGTEVIATKEVLPLHV